MTERCFSDSVCFATGLGASRKPRNSLTGQLRQGASIPRSTSCRARIRRRELDDEDGARQDAARVIDSQNASTDQVLQALSIIGPDNLKSVVSSSALSAKSPEERVWIAEQLNSSKTEAEVAIDVLQPLVAEGEVFPEVVDEARHLLVLSSIAAGRFSDAIKAILDTNPSVGTMMIHHAFNYGMALWGKNRQITQEPFQRVLECDRLNPKESPPPSYLQCMAVAHWIAGKPTEARRLAMAAAREIRYWSGQQVSCWRYLRVPRSDFERDVAELLKLIDGDESVRPRFFIVEQVIPPQSGNRGS